MEARNRRGTPRQSAPGVHQEKDVRLRTADTADARLMPQLQNSGHALDRFCGLHLGETGFFGDAGETGGSGNENARHDGESLVRIWPDRQGGSWAWPADARAV